MVTKTYLSYSTDGSDSSDSSDIGDSRDIGDSSDSSDSSDLKTFFTNTLFSEKRNFTKKLVFSIKKRLFHLIFFIT